MQLVLTEDQEFIAKTAEDFVAEKSPVSRMRELRDNADATGFSRELWKEMADLGWAGIPFTEELGGADLGMAEFVTVLEALGRDAVLVDRRGRSLLDYPDFDVPKPDRQWYRMGTTGLYLDPGAPGVREHLVATFAELLARYPTLDGLHLDYIRHPAVLPLTPGSRFGVGLDFGYGAATRASFELETELRAPTGDAMVNLSRWEAWRRDQVSELVDEIASRSRQLIPEIEMSAAVISYADRAYLTLAQDWLRWLEDGSLDFAVPMIYTLDDRLLRYQAERFANPRETDRIWAGLGTWLFASRPERAVKQLTIVGRAGLRHHALFSYDSMAETTPDGDRPLLEHFVAAHRQSADAPPAQGQVDVR